MLMNDSKDVGSCNMD